MMRSRKRILTAAAVVAVVVIGASTVGALTGRGSREFIAGSSGVSGAAEAGDFSAAAVVVGNFDGDRFDDILMGAPFEDLGNKVDAGQVHAFYGTRNGADASRDRVIHQGTAKVVGASLEDDLFGAALAVGDFDNDGFDDAAVGVPGKDLDGVVDAGKVVVLYGGKKGLTGNRSASLSQAAVAFGGVPGAAHRFGHSVAAGDFNGDGFADLAIGAPGVVVDGLIRAGATGVVYGSSAGLRADETALWITQNTDAVSDSSETDDRFGWTLAAGDFDGNGFDELVVGSPFEGVGSASSAGVVQVFPGSVTGLALTDTLFSENSAGVNGKSEARDGFGISLAVGNFDNDAHEDLAIGVPAEARGKKPATGAVHVFEGTATGLTSTGSTRLTQALKSLRETTDPGDDFGWALVAADFNDTGRDDLAVGVPGERVGDLNGAGVVHVFIGRASGVSAKRAQTWQPGASGVAGRAQSNAGAGRALAAGDIDGDGKDDLVIATPGRSVTGAATAGSFVVLYG